MGVGGGTDIANKMISKNALHVLLKQVTVPPMYILTHTQLMIFNGQESLHVVRTHAGH